MSFTPRARLLRLAKPQTIRSQSRRTYASPPPEPPQRSNNSTWIVITAALGIPAAYYLLQGNSARPSKAPSTHDQPASRKDPAGTNTMSSKQEGLSNADTSNPYVNEPGKSVKGEGETESAKVKGTVSTKRPQT
ncbi:uncharacterized protein BJX67DRAFT_342736 [Aspergillus lucknowensis]|uniref:Uncharacterized protein n=1 Tax=Aspergillus lucknowensis TaxID=176173 RepID=A0ABR4M4V3_9EURO